MPSSISSQEHHIVPASDGYHEASQFTLRGVAVGLLIGTVVAFSNMYFGLQSTTGSLPAAVAARDRVSLTSCSWMGFDDEHACVFDWIRNF